MITSGPGPGHIASVIMRLTLLLHKLKGAAADTEKADDEEDTLLLMACHKEHAAIVRLLLQCGAESIEKDEAMFQSAANAVLRQWNALGPARQEIVRHYAWIFVDLPVGSTTASTQQFRQRMAIRLRVTMSLLESTSSGGRPDHSLGWMEASA